VSAAARRLGIVRLFLRRALLGGVSVILALTQIFGTKDFQWNWVVVTLLVLGGVWILIAFAESVSEAVAKAVAWVLSYLPHPRVIWVPASKGLFRAKEGEF
jgi:hypothetical protein